MKNSKLIALVAVLVVITMVISIVVATSADKKLREEAEQNANKANEEIGKLDETIDELLETIKGLQTGLKDAEELSKQQAALIEQLKQWGIEIENWNEATAVLADKLAELAEKIEAYEEATDEEGTLLLDKEDYDYINWDLTVNGLYEEAAKDLCRATSVAEMDKIIADCLAAVKALPTNVEVFYNTVAAIEADGVTADDKANVLYVFEKDMINDLTADDFAGETKKEREAAEKALEDRFAEALKSYKTAATEKFVAMVNALPSVDDIKITDLLNGKDEVNEKSPVAEAAAQYDHLVNDLGLTFKSKTDAYKCYKTLVELAERIFALVEWKNEVVKPFNDMIADEDYLEVKLTTTSLEKLQATEKALADILAAAEKAFDVELDPTKDGFNSYIYSFLDTETVEGFRADYDALVAVLREAADAYLAAVENLEGKEAYADVLVANDEAYVAFKALKAVEGLNKNTSVATIDVLLENTKTKDVQKAAKSHEKIDNMLGKIATYVEKIDTYVTKTILSRVHDEDCKGGDKCVCEVRYEYNTKLTYEKIHDTYVGTYLNWLLTTDYQFTAEELLGEELLADLEAAFVYAAQAKVMASVNAWAEEDGKVSTHEKQVIAQIEKLYCPDLDSVEFVAVYTEEEIEDEVTGEVEVVGTWAWSEETAEYFTLVDDYCNTDLYNDLVKGVALQ